MEFILLHGDYLSILQFCISLKQTALCTLIPDCCRAAALDILNIYYHPHIYYAEALAMM